MDLFDILSFVGGLAFFLYGMHQLSSSLENMVGGKLESFISKMTSNRWSALSLGALVTAMVQSSSVVTVMVVGLVNSNIMSLSQSVGVIMGSNIGTTITSWILSLVGIEGGNVFTKMLKPDSFAPVVALLGIVFIMFSKSKKRKNLGTIFLGFAILMSGMSIMGDAVEGLKEVPEFTDLMIMFSNPIMGVLVGAIVTAIIQSSSASVGILQSLSLTGAVPFATALPIIMGQNIGTCITALLSSIGANKNAKRVTAVHIYFNIIGTLIFLPVVLIVQGFFSFEFFNRAASPFEIAITHSIFNVLTTAILFPFAKKLEKLAKLTIKDRPSSKDKEVMLDERLLLTPSFAVAESRKVCEKMAEITRDTVITAINRLENYDAKVAEEIEENEQIIDGFEDKLGTYIIKISSESLTEEESNKISQMLHTIGDLERISDHALNITEVSKEIYDKKLSFSAKALNELSIIKNAVIEIVNKAVDVFVTQDLDLAQTIEPLEDLIDELTVEIKNRHVRRLKDGDCTIELGFILSDLLTNLERISDHCSNIAIYEIELLRNQPYAAHEYLHNLEKETGSQFKDEYDKYKLRYTLPARK